MCGHVTWSLISLQRHQRVCQKRKNDKKLSNLSTIKNLYFCSFCSLTFNSALEAIQHRRTTEHKEVVLSKKSKSIVRTCTHCYEKQKNISEHKRHLLEKHYELCHR